MKIVILAAGRGTRLGGLTEEIPKCLLSINGRAIIDYTLDNLKKCGVSAPNIAIVVGFQKEKIINYLGDEYTYIYNEDYANTNNMASFYLAKEFVDNGDCLYLHADIFCDAEIIKKCLEGDKEKSYLVVDTDKWTKESMRVEIKDGYLVNASKELPDHRTHGDWIGIAKIHKNLIGSTFKVIEEQLAMGEKNSYMAVKCFTNMARLGHQLYTLPTEKKEWIEIDFEEELKKANEEVYKNIFN